MEQSGEPHTLGAKLNRLFAVMHRASEPMTSNEAAAEEISRHGVAISPDELRQLRDGTKQATAEQLSATADFFGVSAHYLTVPGAKSLGVVGIR